jgi:hypothetical protein
MTADEAAASAAEVAPAGGAGPAHPRLRIPCWPGLDPPKAWLVGFHVVSGSAGEGAGTDVVPAQCSGAVRRPAEGPAG